jgi:uncharacterized protein (TIGR00156 family)
MLGGIVKKIVVFFLMVTFSVCMIEADERGGFAGLSSFAARKVNEVKNLQNNTDVMLEGKIERKLRRGQYLFNDGTGTITVEIDHKEWRGLTVSPEDVVILYGDVDRSYNGLKIEVDWIEKKPVPVATS